MQGLDKAEGLSVGFAESSGRRHRDLSPLRPLSLLSLKDPNGVADAATGHFQEACFFAAQRLPCGWGRLGGDYRQCLNGHLEAQLGLSVIKCRLPSPCHLYLGDTVISRSLAGDHLQKTGKGGRGCPDGPVHSSQHCPGSQFL